MDLWFINTAGHTFVKQAQNLHISHACINVCTACMACVTQLTNDDHVSDWVWMLTDCSTTTHQITRKFAVENLGLWGLTLRLLLIQNLHLKEECLVFSGI